ncbi:MAG: twin-arginine translocase TatA/TatE family subunit [Bryobacter sp.]|jgi:sec-independent protein translocase protein TatA|nr:twin-arginine translocase TatA/TatE family subunit [Bryobacter sp. CoA8 C33]
MGPLGWQETIFIFLLALLIFGPKKLPELGRNIGKALTEFRRASTELRATFDREMANIERETNPIKDEAHKIGSDIQNTVYDYGNSSYHHDDYGYNYDGYSYPDYTSETSGEVAKADQPTTEESSHTGQESPIQIAQAEGTVAVGAQEEPMVMSTAESATEPASQEEAKA